MNYTVVFVAVPAMVAHTVARYWFLTGISMGQLLACSRGTAPGILLQSVAVRVEEG
jgi:hypothetical protein